MSAKAKTAGATGFLSLGLALALTPAGVLFARQATAPVAAPAAHAAASAETLAKGKTLFDSAVCSSCHTLAAAGASGDIGPSLDQNPNLTHDLIVARVKNGQGAMPPYNGQLSDADVEAVTAYVLSATAKQAQRVRRVR
ncbi:MAG: cytochrome c [Sphingomonas sp.]|nr:cytochrome c [Sphingomonas sp.]